MSRCPFSGVKLRGQEHPKKFLFVEFSVKISENSGTEVSTPLFNIELPEIFLHEKKYFLSSASMRLTEHEKFSCHLQVGVQWFEAEQRLTKGCLLDSSHHVYHLPLPPTFIMFSYLRV